MERSKETPPSAQRTLTVDRRTVLAGLAGSLLAGLRLPSAAAAAKEVVVANWGGLATDGFMKAWAAPLEKAYGNKLVVDAGNPSAGKIRAMVEAHNVTWDACDAGAGTAIQLGEAGLLEEIDYAIVSKAKVRPEFAYRWGVCNYMFSYVMAFNKTKFGDNPPRNWKDFYDVAKFPGKRTLRGLFEGQLEGALLADGVDAKKLYPLDVDRALVKIKSIKDHLIFWKSGAESEDLFRKGEVVAGNMWSNRANLLRVEMQGAIDVSYDGGVVTPAVWLVPKGNPAGKEAAMRFIAVAQEPEGQAELFKIIGMSPANPAAAALIPAELRRYDATQPENLARQVAFDVDWYGKNVADVQAKYLNMMSS
ncbi:MAG: ABC transporter substrate-binding protein [Alphaproteobacteria bacterium]